MATLTHMQNRTRLTRLAHVVTVPRPYPQTFLLLFRLVFTAQGVGSSLQSIVELYHNENNDAD